MVVSERIHPAYYNIGRGWGPLRRLTYSWAKALVVQTGEIAAWCEKRFKTRIEVISNPVAASVQGSVKSERVKRLIGVGRLAGQKGFDFLLEAFSRLARHHEDWTLVIYGEGPERAALEGRIAELGLAGRVELPGWVSDIRERMWESGIFVLSSRFEGFPNALCEAMSCGLPVVSFDCPGGPAEIVRHDMDGFLVPPGDLDKLSGSMEALINDRELRERFGRRAEEVAERFSMDRVVAQWEQLFKVVGEDHRN